MVTVVALCLLGLAAAFQAALALGAPWGRFAYGGRATTADGRLPAALRIASCGTLLVLGLAAWALAAHARPLLWVFAGLFAANTAANLAGTHPVERRLMSACTLTLAGAFLTLAMT